MSQISVYVCLSLVLETTATGARPLLLQLSVQREQWSDPFEGHSNKETWPFLSTMLTFQNIYIYLYNLFILYFEIDIKCVLVVVQHMSVCNKCAFQPQKSLSLSCDFSVVLLVPLVVRCPPQHSISRVCAAGLYLLPMGFLLRSTEVVASEQTHFILITHRSEQMCM